MTDGPGMTTGELLTNFPFNNHPGRMQSVSVIESPEAAIIALDPRRSRLLASLAGAPASATTLAKRLGLPRQQVNYHVRELESRGLVELVEERPRRGVTERIVRASAASYLVSPSALGDAAAAPEQVPEADRLSARYLVALAGRAIREVGDMLRRASGRTVPTLSLDAEIRFRSAAERAAFTDELTRAVTGLVAAYHHEDAEGGRWHRLVILAHPRPNPEGDTR